MAKYPVGRFMASTRNKLAISQDDLSYGICSQTTLSRIENGTQMPQWKVYGALLERLGMPGDCTSIYMSDEEIRRNNLEITITRELANGNYEIEELLHEYWNGKDKIEALEEQFYNSALGIILECRDHKWKEAMEILEKAICLTIPNFDVEQLKKIKLLTFEELTILNNIATVDYELGNEKNAKKLMFYLKEYLENTLIDSAEKAKKYPMILFNLSNWLGKDERYKEQIELCEQGIEFCIKHGKLTLFPFLLFNKGYGLGKIGKLEEAEACIKESYYMFCAMENDRNAKATKQGALHLFGIRID